VWKGNGKTATFYFSWIVSFQNGDIIYVSSAWEDGRQEDEEEDVGGCWVALGIGEDVDIWRRRFWIALCGGTVLGEALDLR
jgi:hypothetical protein